MLYFFLASTALLAYVIVGYPLLLQVIVRLRGARPIRRSDRTPPVSFVISAYNEADVIRDKLENALALDYPAELLEILVVSDCSDDGTDELVRSFASRGVTLARMGLPRQSDRRTYPGFLGSRSCWGIDSA